MLIKNTIALSCQTAMFGEKTEHLLYWLITDRAQRLRQPMLDERKKRLAIPEGLMAGSGVGVDQLIEIGGHLSEITCVVENSPPESGGLASISRTLISR